MKLSNIVNGMTVKNYKAMCELLEEPVKVGKSKQLQIKEWDRFFTYEKQGNKFANIQLREEVLEKVDNRGGARENAGAKADYPFLSELCSYYINNFIERGKPFTCNSLLYKMGIYYYNPSHPMDAVKMHKAFVGCTLSELNEEAEMKYAIGVEIENKRGQYIIEKQRKFQEEIARIKNALAPKVHAAIAKSGIKTKEVWVINGEVATEKQTNFIEAVKKNAVKLYEKRYGKFIGGNFYNTRRLYDMENKMIKRIIEMSQGMDYEDKEISIYKALVVEEFSESKIDSMDEYEEKRLETAKQMAQKISKRYTEGYTYNGEKHTETISQEKAEAVQDMFDATFYRGRFDKYGIKQMDKEEMEQRIKELKRFTQTMLKEFKDKNAEQLADSIADEILDYDFIDWLNTQIRLANVEQQQLKRDYIKFANGIYDALQYVASSGRPLTKESMAYNKKQAQELRDKINKAFNRDADK